MVASSFLLLLFSSCGVYSFHDISIPADVKTVKLRLLENKARYVNPRLAPALTNKLQDKIVGQTKLNRTDSDDADWLITGYISDYSITTSGVSVGTSSVNRLTVSAEMTLKSAKNQKENNFTVTRSFDFSAQQSLPQAEAALFDDIVKGLSDEMFNRLFSDW